MKIKRTFWVAIIALLALSAVGASAAGTTVVGQSDVGVTWSTADTRAGGTVSFVNGPATPPLGVGSLQMTTTDAGGSSQAKAQFFNYSYIGTPLSAIDAMSFSDYRSGASTNAAGQRVSLNIEVDYVGDGSSFTTLVFEPIYQAGGVGALQTNTWQSWDAFNGGAGVWWSTRSIPGAPLAGNSFVPWSSIVANNPNAKILGGFGFNVGSGWIGQFSGNADALALGVSGDTTVYDFEPFSGPPVCTFTTDTTTHTMTLDADCTTDHTILVLDGYTLDGAGHTITAVDPAGGHFLGAVVQNGGAVANVTNVTITAAGLADVCDAGVDRLRGILLDGASGAITDVTVDGVRQGLSGCQEGNAIEVRNAPFDGAHPGTLTVAITDNVVANYQKNGITVNGDVYATVTGNSVTGDGPITYIAQNGIQIGYGASAFIRGNTVSGNNYTPASDVACGLLFYEAGGVRQQSNTLFANERNLCNFGRGGGNPAAPN